VASNRIVVIGASAGGLDALRVVVSGLPSDFATPVCVVVHSAPHAPGLVGDILDRAGSLAAANAADRERLQSGRIHVAPPDMHLVVEPGRLRVTRGPRENGFRPAVDPLFRSVAQVYGPGAIGVVLSGGLDDGTAGLWAIKQLGGIAIVQDPADAMVPDMPHNAMRHVNVDHVVRADEIAPLLVRLTARPVDEHHAAAVPEQLNIEVKIAMEQNPIDAGFEQLGDPSSFACPECHGVLLQLTEGDRMRFRCHTGHAYSIASLLAAIGDGIEDSLWNAIRSLEEGQLLMGRMADHVRAHHDPRDADRLVERADEAKRQSDVLRKLVMTREPVPVDTD
jgi:two-component system, chemotaxis family, protein-glutamate methylesterase/glutaminase